MNIAIKPAIPNKRPTPDKKIVIVGTIRMIPVIIRNVAASTLFCLLNRIARMLSIDVMAATAEIMKSCHIFVVCAR
jgi:hypothetical protein